MSPSTVKAPTTADHAHEAHAFDAINPDDATWILTSAFIIFTMQSGFGLLEAGLVSRKNEVNIMVKNAIDVIFGGLSYWLFGFGLSFGIGPGSNPFCGVGYFLTDADDDEMGEVFAKYFFQLSFATTATTIVSGAMAERTSLKAYVLFSLLNTVTYCFPAHWIWGRNGWLFDLGAIDVAGCGPVHVVGGVSGLVSTLMLKPRIGKFNEDGKPNKMPTASLTNVLLGTFMLWWGWLGFNCGSTFGITGHKWKLASRSAVVTINGSIGGGIFSMMYSYWAHKGKLIVDVFVNGILGGLVSITAVCAVIRPWESLVIGFIGGFIACVGSVALERLRIDDPVGCVATHFFAGGWGLIVAGLVVEKDSLQNLSRDYGVLKGGAWRLLGIQVLALASITLWAVLTTIILLITIDKLFFKLRLPVHIEMEGADKWEHGVVQGGEVGDCCVEAHDEGMTADAVPELSIQHAPAQTGLRSSQRNQAKLSGIANRTLTWRRSNAVDPGNAVENHSEENETKTFNGTLARKRENAVSHNAEENRTEEPDAHPAKHDLAVSETDTLPDI